MNKSILSILLISILASSVLSVQVKLSHVQEKKIKELNQEKWGHIILTLAELHSLSGGALDDLTNAVEELISDLGDRLNELDEDYNQRTLDHQSEVTTLSDEISDAQIDVSSTTNLLQNILYPAIETLQHKIETFHNNINDNNDYVDHITFERESAHEEYETRVSEQNDALSAVDECLGVISEVSNGAISFAQSKSLKHSLENVIQKIPRGADEVIVKALISLATEEFADMGALLKVSNALKEIKQAIIDALNQDHDDEARQLDQFNGEVKEKSDENRQFQRDIIESESELETTQDSAEQAESFLDMRSGDLAMFEENLEIENTEFDEDTQNYGDIRNELVREQSVAQDTLAIINTVGFSSYLEVKNSL